MLAYTCGIAKSEYRNLVRLEIASQPQSSDASQSSYERVKKNMPGIKESLCNSYHDCKKKTIPVHLV